MELFHKIILININFEFLNWQKTYLELSAIFYLFSDLEFILAVNEKDIKMIKQKLVHFSNVKIIIKDLKATTLKVTKQYNTLDDKIFENLVNDGREITNGLYWYQDEIIDASLYINKVPENKTLIYYIGESNISYLYKNYFSNLLNKLANDLSQLKNIDNLIYVYKPIFSYDRIHLNLTNQRIDDAIQVIRNFNKNYFKTQRPILYGANVNTENVLSFCTTNNIDGFVYEWNQEAIDDLLEFVKKVHGWQRIIINQARRDYLK